MKCFRIVALWMLLSVPLEAAEFIRSDCNQDGAVNIADAIHLLAYLFSEGDEPTCMDACDANDDGQTNIADVIFNLNFLKGGGGIPLPPYPSCGDDLSVDAIDCVSFISCP